MRSELLPINNETDNLENKITFKDLSMENKINNRLERVKRMLS